MHYNSSSHTIIKKVVFGLLIIGAFLLTALGMVVILKNMTQKTTSSTKPTSAADIISAYSGPETIIGLSSKLYQPQIDASIEAIVQYKLSGHTYGVTVPTKHSLMFYAVNKSQPDDSATIQSQTATFMQQKGFAKAESPAPIATTGLQYTTFSNDTAVCQLTDSQQPASTDTLRFHSLACVDRSTIEQEYTATEKLLSIYKQSHQLAAFAQATRFTASEGNKSYAIVGFTVQTSPSRLLFAAVDNNWLYLGDLATNNPKYANAKYTITPDILRAISDPKYGDFLIKSFTR